VENKVESNLEINKEDLDFIKQYIKTLRNPEKFETVAYHLAMYKTKEKRQKQVKEYHPDCEFKVGDSIYKEYPSKLPIGGKKFIEVPEGVILKVEDIRSYMGINEIRLSYEGTSDFRKYIEYLKRQKIDLLLPHKQKKPPRESNFITDEIDPRTQQAPLIEREFSFLKKKLITALHKENQIILLSDMILLKENLKPIKAEVYTQIKEFLRTHHQSEKTEFFVENFLHIEPTSIDFSAYCFALNFNLFQDHKIDLQQTNSTGWGRWHLISVLYQLKRNALINETNPLLSTVEYRNKKNLPQRRKKLEEALFTEGESRFFLTQREILSGALRLKPHGLDLGDSLEVEITDSLTKKAYTLYHFQHDHLLLGFDKLFEAYKVIQGTILILEKDEQGRLTVTIRTTKKGTITDRIVFDTEKRVFRVTEEKFASSVFVNKLIYLEAEVLRTLEAKIDEFRGMETLNKLIHKVFFEFGVKERNYELHVLRLYHILDAIFPIDLKQIEDVILSSLEFIPSEKVAGVFFLDSDAVVEIEEEEKRRRQSLIDESRKKREEIRKQQMDEELRKKDEIRLLREERKRKREEEMRIGDVLRQTKEQPKPAKRESTRRTAAGSAAGSATGPARDMHPIPGSMDEMKSRSELTKKPKKKIELDKPAKGVKKGQKKIIEEKIELSEIKKEILQEELIEKPVTEKESKKTKQKEKEVAYQDQSGFTGIFASKLEELVEKGKEKEPDNSGKK